MSQNVMDRRVVLALLGSSGACAVLGGKAGTQPTQPQPSQLPVTPATGAKNVLTTEQVKSRYGQDAVAIYQTDPEFFNQNPWALAEGYTDPTKLHAHGSRTLPREYFTQAFFRQLSRNVAVGNYEAALCSFMPADEREYSTTLGESMNPIDHLISRLGLSTFVRSDEAFRLQQTGKPFDVIYDPSHADHNHVMVRDETTEHAKAVLDHVDNIHVARRHSSAQGIIHVVFDDVMHYATLVDGKIKLENILAGAHYETRFTPHWES